MAPKMPVPKCRIEITLPLISDLTKKKKKKKKKTTLFMAEKKKQLKKIYKLKMHYHKTKKKND